MGRGEAKRGYGDACGTAHGLELLGERWAMLVLRELMLGGRRFSDLRADLPGISANVLTQRLADLEARGLVRRTVLPPPARVQVYEATDWGLEAEPVMAALGRWAARSPGHDPTLPLSPVSMMLSLRTMIDAKKAKGFSARIGFVLNDSAFVLRVKKGEVDVKRVGGIADMGKCDAIIVGQPEAVVAVIYGGQPLGLVDVDGDAALVRRFVTLFPLPAKVTQGKD